MNRLALFATTALFPVAAYAQLGLPAGAGMLSVVAPSPATCSRGTTYADGCPGSPAGTAQLPSILSSYTVRPRWNVAGVEYHVGYPTGQTLIDPSSISVSGVTVNASAHTVTITGNNVTLSGVDYGLDNGWELIVQGTNDIVQNSHFLVGSNHQSTAEQAISVVSSASNTSFLNNTIDGGSLGGTAQASAVVGDAGTGVETWQYNYFLNAGGDLIDFYGNWTSLNVRYNVAQNTSAAQVAHSDVYQFCGAEVANSHFDFNVTYQPGPGTTDGEGLLSLYDECAPANISNGTVRYNTLISLLSDNWGTGTFLENDVGTVTGDHIAVYNNYMDPTGITASPWYASNQPAFSTVLPNPASLYNLTNMTNGALIAIPTVSNPYNGFSTYPDSNGYSPALAAIYTITPSPATGNITTGNTITFSVRFNAPQTVTGTPTITLNDGGTASYVSGSGTNTLIYSHTVASGNSASTLGVTKFNGTLTDDVGGPTTLSPLTNLTTQFSGLSVNNTTPTLVFASLASGQAGGSPVAISGTYTVTAPSGLTNATYGGGCTGSSTIAGFLASGGNWSATATPPPAACTGGTLSVTGTGGNTNTAVSQNTANFSAPTNAITFTSLAGGPIANPTTTGSGGYSGSPPTGLTNATYSAGCGGGSSTVSSFALGSGNTWSAKFTPPSQAGSCTLTVTATY